MGYPGWCALGNRSAHERRDGAFKLSIRHWRGESDPHGVRLRGPVLLQADDLPAARGPEALHLDGSRAVDDLRDGLEVHRPTDRLFDLHDEGPTAPEHPGVH